MIYIRFRIILASYDTTFIRVSFCLRFGPDLTQKLLSRWVPPDSNHVKVIELRHLLSSVCISRHDAVLWQNNATVSVALIWQSFRRRGVPPPWAPNVWHSFAIPKCAFFLWLALKSRLLTKDRMIAFGMSVNPTCVLCGCNDETTEHIFMICPYINLVWWCSPVPLNLNWIDW